MSENPTSQTQDEVPWEQFLANHPPDKQRKVTGLGQRADPVFLLATPDLNLNCDSDSCGGVRSFRCKQENIRFYFNQWQQAFLEYECRNCLKTQKTYALLCRWEYQAAPPPKQVLTSRPATPVPVQPVAPKVNVMEAVKLGEWPPLGPTIPRKLLRLLGPDRALFEAGRRAEGQGMGIGAFAYYRRVVENRRTELFDRLIEAAERLNTDPSAIRSLKVDRDNWQFTHSIEGLKGALPDSLKVQGHNPLALLHNALSHNLHNESDEACLQAAEDIRVVLTFFADQLANVLTERTELEKAVGRLTRPLSKNAATRSATSSETPPLETPVTS